MNKTLNPGKLRGRIRAVSSKSHGHRLLICAALADRPSEIFCPQTSADLDATVRCLNALGANIDYVNQTRYPRATSYERTEPNQIIVDYIASMTDDYLIDLHRYLFPDSSYYVEYKGYFEDLYELRRLKGQLTMDDD
jgi:hypothetical protein